jgi:hypothetical protein
MIEIHFMKKFWKCYCSLQQLLLMEFKRAILGLQEVSKFPSEFHLINIPGGLISLWLYRENSKLWD